MKQTLAILFITSLLSCGSNNKPIKFDKNEWRNGTQVERGNMSTDLVESKILIGKDKLQVIELIGYPKDSTETNFHYLVDFGYMTPFHLDVTFDMTDLKVKKVTLAD